MCAYSLGRWISQSEVKTSRGLMEVMSVGQHCSVVGYIVRQAVM